MKTWALEHGATHFTHWFQPLTGVTAEKHDSFISPRRTAAGDHGLFRQGAGAAASRMRPPSPPAACAPRLKPAATRAWDPTSFAFIKDGRPVHPDGLLLLQRRGARQEDPAAALHAGSLSRQAVRILQLFGDTQDEACDRRSRRGAGVFPGRPRECISSARTCGCTGRTLFGAQAAQGAGAGRPLFRRRSAQRVGRLHEGSRTRSCGSWASLSKTKHNEVAPAQHEMAPIYYRPPTPPCDQNQLDHGDR